MKGYKNKDKKCFNKLSLMLTIPNNIMWILFAIEIKNLFLLFPTSLDFAINLAQLSLYISYSNKTKESEIELKFK